MIINLRILLKFNFKFDGWLENVKTKSKFVKAKPRVLKNNNLNYIKQQKKTKKNL